MCPATFVQSPEKKGGGAALKQKSVFAIKFVGSFSLQRSLQILLILTIWGTRWRSCLNHCATSRKVAGSIPNGITGIFQGHNPSGRTMTLGSTQLLTEMSTRNISWGGKSGRCVRLTTFHLHLPIVWKSGSLNLLETSGTVQACIGIFLPLPAKHLFLQLGARAYSMPRTSWLLSERMGLHAKCQLPASFTEPWKMSTIYVKLPATKCRDKQRSSLLHANRHTRTWGR
jgi:hypothetical protein